MLNRCKQALPKFMAKSVLVISEMSLLTRFFAVDMMSGKKKIISVEGGFMQQPFDDEREKYFKMSGFAKPDVRMIVDILGKTPVPSVQRRRKSI